MLIMAEYRQINEKLKRITELRIMIDREIIEMQNVADNLDIFWDGEANGRYLINVSAGLCNARLLIKKIEQFEGYLVYALNRYQDSEKSISEMIDGVM